MTSSLLTRPREGRGAPHGGRGGFSLHPPAVGTRVTSMWRETGCNKSSTAEELERWVLWVRLTDYLLNGQKRPNHRQI